MGVQDHRQYVSLRPALSQTEKCLPRKGSPPSRLALVGHVNENI